MCSWGQETILARDSATIKSGSGASREVGHDIRVLGTERVMALTDANLTVPPVL
jgi:hypothetical protein